MISIAISTTYADGGEYAAAIRRAGALPELLAFDAALIDAQLSGVSGVLLSGGGDVDPRRYGGAPQLADELDGARDDYEFALVERARERKLPTLCICRGMQVANVAFGGSLVVDIADRYGPAAGDLHRPQRNGKTERGVIAGHEIAAAPGSLLRTIVGSAALATGSRHHQSVDRLAPELIAVAATPDGIVEAVEARFPSPFWLGVQWHPESTLDLDGGASRAIFAAFVEAAERVSAGP